MITKYSSMSSFADDVTLTNCLMQATMRRRASVASAMALMLVASFASTGLGAHTQQEIYAPSYVYPCFTAGCAWGVFKAGATLVIINPASGPGTASNSDYVNLVNTVKAGSSTVKIVLGYVSTSYGARDSTLVLADIDKYYSFYNVDGIFLDEGSTDCSKTSVYNSYDARVKSKAGLGYTVLNWGVYGPECYLTSTHIDNYVTFENAFSQYTSSSASAVPSFVNKYDSSRFWNILHTAPNNQTAVTQAVGVAKTRNVGQVYITNDVMPNPYDTAPASALWTAQVNKAKLCS